MVKREKETLNKNNRTSQISTRYYPNFKCISIFPLQTEKQSTEVLQELNKTLSSIPSCPHSDLTRKTKYISNYIKRTMIHFFK